MNQQEFTPESQDQEQPNTQSYSQYRTSDMPKRDHPSDYSESIPAYSYHAQDAPGSNQQQTASNTKQRTQNSAQQQAGTQQTPPLPYEQWKEQFYRQRQRFSQNQGRNSRQSSPPPYMGTRQQANHAPNFLAPLVVIVFVLLILPIVLKLLFALFIVLLAMAMFVTLLVGSLILFYIFYLKKRWQRSRWWFW